MFPRRTRHIGQFFEDTFPNRFLLFIDGDGTGDGNGAGEGGGSGGGGDGGSGDGSGSGNGSGGSSDSGSGGDGSDGSGEGGAAGAGGLAASVAGAGSGEGSGSDDGAGEGEGSADSRPADLPDQFWNADDKTVNTDALIKAHNDTKADRDRLANIVGENGEAPKKAEDYFKTDLVENDHMRLPDGDIPAVKAIYPDGVPTDDPLLKSMAESALKRGVSREAFLGFVGDFLIHQNEFIPEAIDIDGEFEALGKDGKGKAIVEDYTGWVHGMQTNGLLSAEDVTNMIAFGANASEIRTLRKIKAITEGKSNVDIIEGENVGEGLPSKEAWYAARPPVGSPPDEIEKWRAQGVTLFGTAPGGSSEPGRGMPSSHGATTSR